LGHLGMPAFVQPTHLLAATLLFGLQFLIWMSYRHSRDSVLLASSEATHRVVNPEQIATAT